MKRRLRYGVVAGAITALALTACAPGAETSEPGAAPSVHLDFATELGPSTGSGLSLQRWADAVEEATDGRVTSTIHWTDSLVTQAQVLDALQSGVATGAIISGGYHPAALPMWVQLGTVHDLDRTLAVTGPDQATIVERLLEEFPEMSQQLRDNGAEYMYIHAAPPHNLMANTPIEEVADLSGLTIRSYGTGIPQMLEAVGATPVSAPFSEVYASTATNAVSGAFSGLDLFRSISYNEVAPNITILGANGSSPLTSTGLMTVISTSAWERISPEDQETIRAISRETGEWLAGENQRMHEEALQEMLDAGAQVYEMSDEQTALWRSLMPDLFAQAALEISNAGYDGDAFVARVLEIADDLIANR